MSKLNMKKNHINDNINFMNIDETTEIIIKMFRFYMKIVEINDKNVSVINENLI
jgi:hypothetical protein